MEVSLESSVVVSVSPTEHETSKEFVTNHFDGGIRSALVGAVALETSPAAASSFSFAVKKVGVMPIAPMPP